MGKKRRKPDHTGRPSQPHSDTSTGEIPWSAEDLGAAFTHAATLHHTPHDDWDRREKGLSIIDDDGSISRIVINPDMMPNQIMDFIVVRERKKGTPNDVIMSHMWRFVESMAFLRENNDLLRDAGLVVDDPDDADATLISDALIKMLATAKYEGVSLRGPDKDPIRCFHAEKVIADAKRIAEIDDAN